MSSYSLNSLCQIITVVAYKYLDNEGRRFKTAAMTKRKIEIAPKKIRRDDTKATHTLLLQIRIKARHLSGANCGAASSIIAAWLLLSFAPNAQRLNCA